MAPRRPASGELSDTPPPKISRTTESSLQFRDSADLPAPDVLSTLNHKIHAALKAKSIHEYDDWFCPKILEIVAASTGFMKQPSVSFVRQYRVQLYKVVAEAFEISDWTNVMLISTSSSTRAGHVHRYQHLEDLYSPPQSQSISPSASIDHLQTG